MTKPLTPIDCDLRSFPFMPLDVVRLRDSDLAAMESPEACWSAVLLWCASWHQIPAASLPNDDRVLANLAGFGRVIKEWQKVKEGALRGWQLCEDGRFYHPVIAEKALSSLESKYKQEWRTEVARIKKHNQRNPNNKLTESDYESWLSHRANIKCLIGQQANVSQMSQEKRHPTEIEIDTDIINLCKSVEDSNLVPNQLTEKTHTQIQVGLIVEGLRAIGMMPFNPQLPDFLALIEAGATHDEFVNTALEKRGTSKFNIKYLLTTMINRRNEKAEIKPKVLPKFADKDYAKGVTADGKF